MNDRVLLVTGGNGLVGHAVIAAAAGNWACVSHDARPPLYPVTGIDYVAGDLLDAEGIADIVRSRQITHIVHSGGISHPLIRADQPALVAAINVDGTRNVLEAARQNKVLRVVYMSSGAVYGSSPPDRMCTEELPLRPDTIYGATKAASEMLASGYGRVFGLELVILRPVSIYGPRRQTFSMPGYLIACALDDIAVRVKGSDQEIDFIYIDDVIRAVLVALETTTGVGRVYNIASGTKTRYSEVAAIVRKLVPDSRIVTEPGLGDLPPEGRFSTDLASREIGFHVNIGLAAGLGLLKNALANRSDLRATARAAATLVGDAVVELGHA